MIQKFLKYLQESGLNRRTVYLYQNCLNRYLNYMGDADLLSVDTETIKNYYSWISSHGYASSTSGHLYRAVYRFYSWLTDQGYLILNPAFKPENIKKGLPRRVPTMEEIKEAHEKLFYSEKTLELRDSVLFDIAYSCGLRRMELHELDVNSVDQLNRTISVSGKRDKKRVVPIGEKCLKNVQYYIVNVRPKLLGDSRSTALFIGRQSKKRLTLSGINRVFERLRKDGASSKLTPHALRHAFATNLLQNGAMVQDISKMLGHDRLSTTMIYTRLVISDLKSAHKLYHPRA